MSIHVHHLTGCSPIPLAHYLKALGILRLVAEQKDPGARGWWQDEAFHLTTALDPERLERFFLEEYTPTPIIDPWNKGSGFVFAANNPCLARIEASKCGRLKLFRDAIVAARGLVLELTAADARVRKIKDETKIPGMSAAEKQRIRNSPKYKARLAEANRQFSSIKEGLIPRCRRLWRGRQQEWMDAALVLTTDNERQYPAILGIGGADGKNDFTKQFMESLGALMDFGTGGPAPSSRERLGACLYMMLAESAALDKLPVGQFLPSMAGGANMGNATDADSSGNPWDYVLLLEGVILMIASATRRMNLRAPVAAARFVAAAAPFVTRPLAAGFASSSEKEGAPGGEQWMPLWRQPCSLAEIRHLMAEGRAQLGASEAVRPTDFARSVARLGVARGIAAFQRYGYLKRNGRSNLAVPLGRWHVTSQPHQELLDDLDRHGWLRNLRRAAGDKHAPAGFVGAHRRLEDAIMAVCSAGREASRWQALLVALADCESQMVRSGKFTADRHIRPIPPLGGGWVEAADDGSVEFRLALALALQAADPRGHDPVRRHWLPLDKSELQFATDANGLHKDPGVVCGGLDTERDLIALLQRRLIDGTRWAASRFPLCGMPGHDAHPADVAAFVDGAVDDARLGGLARALMALDRRTRIPPVAAVPNIGRPAGQQSLYSLFRLAILPWPLIRGGAEMSIPPDLATFNRLAAGDLPSAGETAIRRLKASGLVPVIRRIAGDPAYARRLAASLAFPISIRMASRLADRLTKPEAQNEEREGDRHER